MISFYLITTSVSPFQVVIIKLGKGDDGEHQYKTKKFLLWTFQELVGLLKKEEDDSPSSILFTTLYRYISSHKEYIRKALPQRIHQKKQDHTSKLFMSNLREPWTFFERYQKELWQQWHSNKMSWFARKNCLWPSYSGMCR